MFQVSDYKALITMFHRLPGVQISSVSDETNVNVSMRNWARYQGDLSTPRVRRFRQNETAKTRSRREVDKTRREVPPVVPRGDLAIVSAFDAFWTAYPHKVGKDAAAKAWAKRKCDGERVAIMAGLERTLPHLTRDGGKYMPNPATWLNQGRWKDEPKPMLLISPENAEAARGFLEAR